MEKEGCGEGVDEGIALKKWKEHFMELLGGQETGGQAEELEEEEEEHGEGGKEVEGISREEIIEALRGLKKGKAPGTDGIENEAWRFMPKEIGENCTLLEKIWQGGGRYQRNGGRGL